MMDAAGDTQSIIALILTEVRLPRALIALVAGATLAFAAPPCRSAEKPAGQPWSGGKRQRCRFGASLTLYSGIATSFWLALPAGGMVVPCWPRCWSTH